MLDDGVYDVIVVDVEPDGAGTRLEVAVLAGSHKGEVLPLHVEGLADDPLGWLGLPGTLTVSGGEPSVVVDQ